jgi:transaldolase
MKFFLDTANLDELRQVAEMGLLDGVTTNPSLIAKEGVTDIYAHYKAICKIVPEGDVSAEVIATETDKMVQEGITLAEISDNIVVKVPMTPNGIRAIFKLTEEGIRTNCTLIFSPVQALIAAKAGADFVSPFIGRLDDIAHDGVQLIRDIRDIFDNYFSDDITDYEDEDTDADEDYYFYPQILAASIRHTRHVAQCALAGADICTMPFKVFQGLFSHPLTDKGLAQFLEDYTKAFPKS